MLTYLLNFSRRIVPFFICFLTTCSFAQSTGSTAGSSSRSWIINPYDQNYFIENRGQFDGKDMQEKSDILYGVDDMGIQIYFTPKGLTWCLNTQYVRGENQFDGFPPDHTTAEKESGYEEGEEEHEAVYETYPVSIEWIGANPNVEVLASDIDKPYFNYMNREDPVNKSIYFLRGYKTLTYKNIYPGIDVRYVFHPEAGIKYSIHVQPGADPSVIKMQYKGAKSLFRDPRGNLHMVTPFGDMIDHAPETFYAEELALPVKELIGSKFKINDHIVTFHLKNYDKTKELIIDPWTVAPLGVDSRAFEIDKDAAGNVYVFGGVSTHKSQKFDAAGNPLWTFVTSYTNGHGDMAVDPAGNSYLSEACSTTGVIKLNPAGTVIWQSAAGTGYEFWRLNFNCDYTKLAMGGSGGVGNITYINPATGAIGAFTNCSPAEIRAMVWAPGCNIYGITLNLNNSNDSKLISIRPNFTTVYAVVTGLVMNYAGPAFKSGTICCCSAINSIAADHNFVYLTDGSLLDKRNKVTGASIATNILAGGLIDANAGIAVDSCGNVYAGSQNNVYKYDNAFVQVGAPAAVPGAVYDMAVGPNGEILACGSGFVASLDMGGCKPLGCSKINLSFSTTDASCGSKNGSATVTPSGSAGPYTYKWTTVPIQTTQTAINLGAGTYNVTVTDGYGCTSSAAVVVNSASGMNLTASSANISCFGANDGTATANVTGGNDPYTYSWNTVPAQSTQTIQNLGPGTYTVTVTDSNNCSTQYSVTIDEPPALSAFIGSKADVTCPGGNDGMAIVTVSGGTGSYTYSWNTVPVQNSQTATNLSQGTYTITVTDSNNCTKQQIVTINEPPAWNSTVSSTPVSCKGGDDGTATATPSGGTPPYSYSWNTASAQTTQTATGLTAGMYTAIVTDTTGCSDTLTVTVTEPATVLAVVLSCPDSVLIQGDSTSISANVSGGSGTYSYTWNPNIGSGPGPHNVMPLSTTTYTVTVQDMNVASNCPLSMDSLQVQVNSLIPPVDPVFYYHVPNAFSPDADGVNEGFKGIGEGIIDYRMAIYDRWGEKVFETTKLEESWNGGKFNDPNQRSPVGTYVYIVQLKSFENKKYTYNGVVNLTR